MFNNINENGTEYLYNSHFDRQASVINLGALKANAIGAFQANNQNPYVDRTEISSNAIELFQRDCDINKFNKIALTDMDDMSHIRRMEELFSQGVIDAYEDEVLSKLVENSKLWEDIGL